MFIWRKEEPVEDAAMQILNILYSVPQLSVRLEDIPNSHLDMIRYWFEYWNSNKEVLLEDPVYPASVTVTIRGVWPSNKEVSLEDPVLQSPLGECGTATCLPVSVSDLATELIR